MGVTKRLKWQLQTPRPLMTAHRHIHPVCRRYIPMTPWWQTSLVSFGTVLFISGFALSKMIALCVMAASAPNNFVLGWFGLESFILFLARVACEGSARWWWAKNDSVSSVRATVPTAAITAVPKQLPRHF